MEVYKAISAVQRGLSAVGIAKERVTQAQGRYKYRGIDDVYDALSALLPTHGLCILPRMVSHEVQERAGSGGGVVFYHSILVEYDLVAVSDGSTHMVSAYGEAMDSGDKGRGKAMSYAYKSMAFMVFSIPLEGQDNDPDQHTLKPEELPPTVRDLSPAAFGAQKISWKSAIESGRKTPGDLALWLSIKKLKFTEEQKIEVDSWVKAEGDIF